MANQDVRDQDDIQMSAIAEMDGLTNRSRTFAEAVVTMVSLVLPTAALQGKGAVTGLDVPKFVLMLAGPTIITGICPLLSCCILDNQHPISDVAALLSAAILLCLACWIATFTTSIEFWSIAGALFLCFTALRIISYCMERRRHGLPPRTKDFHTVLDGSHEFMCCMTGIHFLWLESLALEGLIGKSHGIQKDLSEVMGTVNIICCAIGLCTLLIEMTPPLTSDTMDDIAGYLFWFDTFMIITIATVLVAAIWKSLVLPGLLPHILGTVIIIVGLILITYNYVCCPEQNEMTEPPKLAPLGLTKLMVTGFLAVYISIDSTNRSITYWFLAFAAAAILSGLLWRLLTQYLVRKVLKNNKLRTNPQAEIDTTTAVASSAKTACFCAHTFVAIAALLLMIEIYNVKKSTIAAAPAPAPASIPS